MEKRLVSAAFLGFVVLSVFGVLLRLMPLTNLSALNYSFILHAHSHFAFSGWIFFSLALLIIKVISPAKVKDYKRFFIFTLICAFGMLISFSLQGYKAISISFSTLFIFANYYFAYKILRNPEFKENFLPVARPLIRAALLFLCVSSLGPFALGPLMVAGLKASPFYNDAIYFYLHFQMNGWMLLGALGLILNSLQGQIRAVSPKWLNAFIFSTIPLYLIFTLWNSPPFVVRATAFAGAVINLVSWIMIVRQSRLASRELPFLLKASIFAISMKVFFQVLICWPPIGTWVFLNRNLIIGYIHLLTLGSVMPMILQQFLYSGLVKETKALSNTNGLFIAFVIIYLVLLFIQPALALVNVFIPHFQALLLAVAVVFLFVGFAYLFLIQSSAQPETAFVNNNRYINSSAPEISLD